VLLGGFLAAALLAHPTTAVVHVSPLNAAGALKAGYSVAHRYDGARCQRGSATIGSAYRCFTPQSAAGVYDPCWVTQTTDKVGCMTQPWKHRVVRLGVTGGYDADPFAHVSTPWGVQLAGGNRCQFVPGSVHSIDGRPLRYYCHHHVVLAGSFDRSRRPWRVRAYVDVTPHAADATYRWHGLARVAKAWFGTPSRQD